MVFGVSETKIACDVKPHGRPQIARMAGSVFEEMHQNAIVNTTLGNEIPNVTLLRTNPIMSGALVDVILHEDVTEAGVTEGSAVVDANNLAGTNDLGDIEIMNDQESIDLTEELLCPVFVHKCGQMGETGVRAMAHATSAHREQRDRELRDLNMRLLNDENEDEGEPSS